MADQLITRTSSSGIWVSGGGTDVRTYALRHLVLVTTGENLAAARVSPETRPEPSGRELGLIYFQRGAKKTPRKTRIGFDDVTPCARSPACTWPGPSPTSPEQKRIFAAASRLFDIVTRLPPLNSVMSRAATKPQGRGAAPPVTSADCGLSQRGNISRFISHSEGGDAT